MKRLALYKANDCIPPGDGLRVVFLLESPYGTEVIHKHPLAGDSGRAVSDWMVKNININNEFSALHPQTPFGCHLKTRGYPKIGLINCSLIPMDKSTYNCSIDGIATTIISGMDLIRKNPSSTRRNNPLHMRIEQKIIANLTSRLRMLPDSVLIVPCGDVARSMVIKVGLTLDFYGFHENVFQTEVPHPSHNQWAASANQQVMEDLRNKLRTRLGLMPDVP